MSELEPTRTYSNPTATEILRRMLDERGVEWWEATPCKTKWNSPIIGGPVAAREWNGEMVLDTGYIAVTPEQAIAATLGAGTCHVWAYVKWDWDRCEPYWEHDLSCGHTVMTMEPVPPRFCPNCGRKVVDE